LIGRGERERVLVAVMAETRAWELTAESFFSNVIEPLGADLALCVGDHEGTNPFYERAKFVWRTAEPDDWAELYDRKVGSSRWRALLMPGGQLLTGTDDPEAEGSGAIVHYFRQFLAESIERQGIADQYDWLIVTRSDLLWPIPHPGTRHLSNRHIYALDGEGYGGIGDRHLIVPRRLVGRFLEVSDPMFTDPDELRKNLDRHRAARGWPILNPERFLAARFVDLGLWRHTRFLPYLPYAVRPPGGSTRWSEGVFDDELGFYVKYPNERERSRVARRFIHNEEGWERFLSPIRGARMRRALRAAYLERGLHERPFVLRDIHPGVADRLRVVARRQEERNHRVAAGMGRQLRRIPGLSHLLDARLRHIRRRAGRRAARDP
jgi:hypothetical protein